MFWAIAARQTQLGDLIELIAIMHFPTDLMVPQCCSFAAECPINHDELLTAEEWRQILRDASDCVGRGHPK